MIKQETLNRFSDKYQLTARQHDILRQVLENDTMGSAEIAGKIGCSINTVNVHLSNIFSKVGCGSRAEIIRFVMSFAAAEGAAESVDVRPFIILSADDDPMLQSGISRLADEFFKGKITLTTCSNGQEVLMYLSRVKIDDRDFPCPNVILLDLQMPRMDGYQTLQRIKSDAALRNIPVVVFSGTISQENCRELYAMGANSIVLKPTHAESLTKVVIKILQYWGL